MSDSFVDETVPVRSYYRPDEDPLPELEIRALRLCRGRVLDLGAGAGRHTLELQRRGHDVVAVDVAKEAVTVMRERGVGDARVGTVADLEGETFDTILMLMNGIGLAGDLDGLLELLRALRSLLSPEGRIVCDSADLQTAFKQDAMRALAGLGPRSGYAGEVDFRLAFAGVKGSTYKWLFIDHARLAESAGDVGLKCEVLARGSRGSYLARLAPV